MGNGHIPRVGILYRHSCGQVGHIGISRPKVGIYAYMHKGGRWAYMHSYALGGNIGIPRPRVGI